MGPGSDMYGSLDAEDSDEFEGLEPDNERELAIGGHFQRDEVRSFDRDFEYDLDVDDRISYYSDEEWCTIEDALEEDQEKLDSLLEDG